MNTALIFAGGTGQRMNTKTRPKQFLELYGKPVIIYTIEQFENHPGIDGIVVVCLTGWECYLQKLLDKFCITKVKVIVSGGKTGQDSIYRGLFKLNELYPAKDTVVLVHDGVRPLINEKLITENIICVEKFGNAITVSSAVETIAIRGREAGIDTIIDRSRCLLAKAPQSFLLHDILTAHERARKEDFDQALDSASLMRHYDWTLHTVEGPTENIKITAPIDFYIFRAIIDAQENSQIFGV